MIIAKPTGLQSFQSSKRFILVTSSVFKDVARNNDGIRIRMIVMRFISLVYGTRNCCTNGKNSSAGHGLKAATVDNWSMSDFREPFGLVESILSFLLR